MLANLNKPYIRIPISKISKCNQSFDQVLYSLVKSEIADRIVKYSVIRLLIRRFLFISERKINKKPTHLTIRIPVKKLFKGYESFIDYAGYIFDDIAITPAQIGTRVLVGFTSNPSLVAHFANIERMAGTGKLNTTFASLSHPVGLFNMRERAMIDMRTRIFDALYDNDFLLADRSWFGTKTKRPMLELAVVVLPAGFAENTQFDSVADILVSGSTFKDDNITEEKLTILTANLILQKQSKGDKDGRSAKRDGIRTGSDGGNAVVTSPYGL